MEKPKGTVRSIRPRPVVTSSTITGLVRLAAVAFGGAAFFYLVFVKLLGVLQPPGLF